MRCERVSGERGGTLEAKENQEIGEGKRIRGYLKNSSCVTPFALSSVQGFPENKVENSLSN